MNLAGLEGKELRVGNMINSIGTGLERALQEQVRSERLKADLITNVSHDIKTPLTSIINYVDLLKREQIPGNAAREYLKVLDQKSRSLKNLNRRPSGSLQGKLRKCQAGDDHSGHCRNDLADQRRI